MHNNILNFEKEKIERETQLLMKDASEIKNIIKELNTYYHKSLFDKALIKLIGLDRFNYDRTANYYDTDYLTLEQILKYYNNIKITYICTDFLKRRNILNNNIFSSIIYVAIISSFNIQSKLKRIIQNRELLATDGDIYLEIDISDIYISDNFDIINKPSNNSIEVSSLGELLRKKRRKSYDDDNNKYILRLDKLILQFPDKLNDIDIEKYPDLKLTEEDLIIYSNIQREIDSIFKLVYTFTLADILNDIEKNFKKNPTTEIKLVNIEDGKLKIKAYINWRITYER